MHFVNIEQYFWGGHGIVGGHLTLGGCLAFANKYNGINKISATFFGDGAVDQGVLHETLNMSQLWKLPAIYVVENNGYSMGTSVRRHTVVVIYERAYGYGLRHSVVYGLVSFN